MRGYLSLDPGEETLDRLVEVQNRLRDALTRQGVHFTERTRLAPTLIQWPFGTEDEIEEAAGKLTGLAAPTASLLPLAGKPNADRPAEIGFAVHGVESEGQPLSSISSSR